MNRVATNIALYVVVMVAAALLVVAAVRVLGDHPGPTSLPVKGLVELDEASGTEQQRYTDILDSASTEATAFVNIRYDDAQASIDAVMAGATGDFRDQYAKSTDGVIKVLQSNKSIMTGDVLWTGVVAQDPDSATVIVATSGTVQNKQTGDKPVARYFRLQLQLVSEKGKWLTSDLQFVP
ncbi:MAG: Mce-associated rane protein [Nocardioidaceae bacterium]|jgi:Mce-associated membrane protein|nr:Mce-associated rane protein [Nocardioidaceae bacterium]